MDLGVRGRVRDIGSLLYTVALNHSGEKVEISLPNKNTSRTPPRTQFGCCMGRIWDSGKMCDATTAAPCIIDEEGAS